MAATPDYAGHFSDRNIPFGIASSAAHPQHQAATRIGNAVVFLADLAHAGTFASVAGLPGGVFAEATLNSFAALPQTVHTAVRTTIQALWRQGGDGGGPSLFPRNSVEDISAVTLHLPVHVSDFADFSCSLEHVQNAGRIIIQDGTPPPGFFHFPIAYQGRASSVVVSGTPIERPVGQFRDRSTTPPTVVAGPSRQLDYEMEFAAVVGRPLPMRQRLAAADADPHIFGFVVLNDWSARDIQGFEMVPLGPCNGKNAGTTISPWIVTLDALAPYVVQAAPTTTATVQPWLADPTRTTYDVQMQVAVQGTTVGTANVASLYWSLRQMLAHIVSAGAPLRTGDLLATGTVSEAGAGHHGCLLESTEGGTQPVALGDGTKRAFLQDGDVVRMTAVAGGADSGVGWGACTGQLVAAREWSV
ncbi:fumarylacetoacetase [Sporothrix schenckii ATCC 58251]|uniref:Fumarylacetoacetase n=1 Tax=Sporothrix schenckii (strain ATCC 58251 / de Perez 2211183) TaxID=1391915 RepID=U7PQQ5_SPOS1|nr:fumarylacetoacetase [Sporothrix schenckii ATCC 58251]